MANKNKLPAEERKAGIVDAAVRLFAERGFRGTTTRELAAAVNVSEPVLYQHFATKRALYDAIIESTAEVGPGNTGASLASFIDAGDDKGFFTRLAGLILDWHLKDPRFIRLLLFSALERHELSDLFYQRHIVFFYKMLRDYIERRMKQGAFRKMDPILAARAFTGMIAHQGMATAVFCREDPRFNRKRIVEAMVDIFLNGIRNHGVQVQ